MLNVKKWQRAELLLFTLVTIINLIPYLSTRFFPSMDGASHLANSNIINQLIFHNNELFNQFFRINPEPVPNWTSHLFISLLTLIIPVFLAEKILLIILLAGIPFVFRALMKTISPTNALYCFLIFPFTHSMFFFFGFFNFCVAVLFFIIALNYWLRNYQKPWNPIRLLILTVLIAITYFSHILVFGTLLIIIAMHILTGAILGIICRKNSWKDLVNNFVKQTVAIAIAAIVPLTLFVYFFYTRPGIRDIKFIPREELINYLITIRPLISFNISVESRPTMILFFMLLFFVMVGLAMFFLAVSRKIKTADAAPLRAVTSSLPGFHFWWLLGTMIILLSLYFILPDAYGTASYTSLRIAFVFFLIIILWISSFKINWWFGVLAIIAGIFVNSALNRIYNPTIQDLGKLAVSCYKAADHIKPNSLVLPIYCMDNWFTGHFVDYLAVEKPVVMVYNYECESGYFPVIWSLKAKPNYYLGNPSAPDRYINFEIIKGNPFRQLDYVFILGQYDPAKDWFFTTLHKIVTEQFDCVYQTENCRLYQSKIKY
ncbi:MAG: hypothetical protein NT004_10425 [Bacteroidetes bacterium]|nr:hypothetical protein [Bacteroidota bacterium]